MDISRPVEVKIKKVFVTGGSGMLGSTLYKVFSRAGVEVVSTDINPLDPWSHYLDVRDRQRVRELILRANPNAVLNLAALTDLEYCEANPQEAFYTNGVGAENVALICRELDIPLVHISTAGVFDGTKQSPYTEEDLPNPINVYGRSKYEAEKTVISLTRKHFIFRAGWMVGGVERDKKFVKKILNQINQGKKVLHVVTDKMGCPTSTTDLSKAILKMLDTSDYGLYHMVSEGNCSRFDVAAKIIDVLKLKGVSIVPHLSGDEEILHGLGFTVARARSEVLENKKVHDRGLKLMRSWDEALTEYLTDNFLNAFSNVELLTTAQLRVRRDESKEVYSRYESDFAWDGRPVVSIVTTAYNNEKFNEKYFESIRSQTYKNIEVIFVDNASMDRTVESAKTLLQNGKVIASKVNTGCAGGNNLGVEEAGGKYIFLFGPDAWMDPNCVENLVKASEGHEDTVFAPRQMAYDGTFFISCGIAVDIFGYPARTYTPDGSHRLRRPFYADGTGTFTTRDNFLKVGLEDEDTFLYHEDVDFSWKCHLVGLKVEPVPQAVLYHFCSAAVGSGGFPESGKVYFTNFNRRFLAERNIIRNIIKNYRWWNVLWVLPFFFLINIFESLALILTGQVAAVWKTYPRAYWWNIANLRSTLRRRQAIQKVRKVGDREILKIMYFLPSKFLGFLEIGVPRVN
ncbi:MAG: sugar nucleotide-binding protein [Patescibacteria group bacterium]|nr:sugar nucleotide-binding protein [Patescibacteria group bacterium]